MIEPLVLVRAVHVAATLIASGTACLMVLIVGADMPAQLRRRLIALAWIALAPAALSGALWLVLLASDIFGEPLLTVCLQGGAWSVLTDTRFGQVLSARLLLAVLLAYLVTRSRLGWLKLGTAAVFAALPAWIGHAGANLGTKGDIHLASDVVHLLAATAWFGGLPGLALALRQTRLTPDWAARAVNLTSRFSRLGLICVATLIATGLVNSWNLLGGPRDLIDTPYGRILGLKLALFVAMLAVAAVNRFHLTPRLPETAAFGALARNSVAETVLGLGIMLFVGALGTMPPSRHVHPASAIPDGTAYVHIHTTEAMADVIVDPGRAAEVRVTIRLSREDGSVFPAKSVRLVLEPPQGGGSPVTTDTKRTDNGWETAELSLRVSGAWTVKVFVGSERGGELLLDAPLLIEP